MRRSTALFRHACLAAILLLGRELARGETGTVQELVDANRILAEQVRTQQRQIDELRRRLDQIETPAAPAASAAGERDRPLRISAEAGIAYFNSQARGMFPNAEFRVDDARLFFEAPVWNNVYFFGGVELTTREQGDENFHVGELYVDAEDVWRSGRDRSLSVRAGRMHLPYGEEYQVRNVIDNPLVSHSVADIWGIDEGVQVYGQLGRFRYNLAVLNGGHATLRDYDPGKSIVARIGFTASPQLALSASLLRTGTLTVAGDKLSEVWLGNAFFRALGPNASTFSAEMAELDGRYHWSGGHLAGHVGWIDFDDNDPALATSRRFSYYGVEAMQNLVGRWFMAARYSAIRVAKGYPLAGLGNAGDFFYSPFAPLTRKLERTSVGVGYRFGPPLVWKLEYSWESGLLLSGTRRDNEDTLASQLGIRF